MDITPELLDAIIQVESSGNPYAFNPKSKARGLTQITPLAWQDLTVHYPKKYKELNYERDIFKPTVARHAGRDYLSVLVKYLNNYGIPITMDNLLASYNWGVGNLKKKGLKKAPKETQNYIEAIKGILNE